MNFRDDYPGQERLLLLGVRTMMLLLIIMILGVSISERIVDPYALAIAGIAGYGLYLLREF